MPSGLTAGFVALVSKLSRFSGRGPATANPLPSFRCGPTSPVQLHSCTQPPAWLSPAGISSARVYRVGSRFMCINPIVKRHVHPIVPCSDRHTRQGKLGTCPSGPWVTCVGRCKGPPIVLYWNNGEAPAPATAPQLCVMDHVTLCPLAVTCGASLPLSCARLFFSVWCTPALTG